MCALNNVCVEQCVCYSQRCSSVLERRTREEKGATILLVSNWRGFGSGGGRVPAPPTALASTHYYTLLLVMATAIDAKGAKRFLLRNPEKAEHNQYWYSPPTIEVLAGEAVALASLSTEGSAPCRIAFISTPSLYFAVPAAQRSSCWVLDIDRKWAKDPHFVYYDFNDNEGCLGAELRGTFDLVVIDPPFITREVRGRREAGDEAVKRGGRT